MHEPVKRRNAITVDKRSRCAAAVFDKPNRIAIGTNPDNRVFRCYAVVIESEIAFAADATDGKFATNDRETVDRKVVFI